MLSQEATGASGREHEPILGLCCGVVGGTCPSADASPPFYITLFSTFASVQERKLQDLEVELETRVKDVKARLAQLDIQVRGWGWRPGSLGALDLSAIAPPRGWAFLPLRPGPGDGEGPFQPLLAREEAVPEEQQSLAVKRPAAREGRPVCLSGPPSGSRFPFLPSPPPTLTLLFT